MRGPLAPLPVEATPLPGFVFIGEGLLDLDGVGLEGERLTRFGWWFDPCNKESNFELFDEVTVVGGNVADDLVLLLD
jgi:hypothetical protein